MSRRTLATAAIILACAMAGWRFGVASGQAPLQVKQNAVITPESSQYWLGGYGAAGALSTSLAIVGNATLEAPDGNQWTKCTLSANKKAMTCSNATNGNSSPSFASVQIKTAPNACGIVRIESNATATQGAATVNAKPLAIYLDSGRTCVNLPYVAR